MSQYGGPGRPTGSGDYGSGGGSGDGGDDDRYTSPFGEPGGQDPYDPDRPPFGYQSDERYWTDYLRIAAPVVGVILMLGLVWFWVANMLDSDDNDVNNDDQDLSGPVIDADTPEATSDDDGENGDEPVTVATPGPDDENGDATDEETEGAPSTIGPGATVVVTGTGDAGLNVRSAASTEAEVLDSIPDGGTLTITGESEQGDGFTWWPVDSGETTGFVVEDFIELSQ